MADLENLKKWFQDNREELLSDFFTFLKFQTISAQASSAPEFERASSWLQNYLQQMGMKVEVWQKQEGQKPEKQKQGWPILLAEHFVDKDKPTVLIYNHYDVQPADPEELWQTPPFSPSLRDGKVFARGAQDNKGQCFYVLLAIQALLAQSKNLPVNLKLLIEGEEEIGSASLEAFLKEKKEALKADHLIIADLGIPHKHTPAITLGSRGIITFNLSLKTASSDLHSGSYGGIAQNAVQILVEILASLHDASGKVTVPGFDDDCQPLSAAERERLDLNFDANAYETYFQAKPLGGEKSFSPLERAWVRPTLEINGIEGGYTGEGFKTIIPAQAKAKISCRLVPNQQPQKIAQLLKQFLEAKAPLGASLTLEIESEGGEAMRTDSQSLIVQALKQAYEETFQKPCLFTLEGGSIPITPKLAKACQAKTALMGLGLAEDNIHAPNENFSLERLEQGLLIIARTLQLLPAMSKKS